MKEERDLIQTGTVPDKKIKSNNLGLTIELYEVEESFCKTFEVEYKAELTRPVYFFSKVLDEKKKKISVAQTQNMKEIIQKLNAKKASAIKQVNNLSPDFSKEEREETIQFFKKFGFRLFKNPNHEDEFLVRKPQ